MLLRLLLITKTYQNLSQNSIKSCSNGKISLGQSPPQELEEGMRSGLHLLVIPIVDLKYLFEVIVPNRIFSSVSPLF